MSTLSDIDKINDIVEMVTTMASLKISTKGLKTLDEMKQKVKETLRSSKKKSSWTAKEAFSVLTEAKKEDERKRATLLHFYEHSDLCLNKMDEKVHTLFKKNIGNLKDKIASHKESLLQKEYIVLVAGKCRNSRQSRNWRISYNGRHSKEVPPRGFAFIYVINSENAGGIQRDRVEKLIEHARQVSLDKQRESSSNCALFVCNKWDQVPSEETNEVKNFIVSKLKKCWPSLNPESQIIYMSAKVASEAQKLGVVTEEFGELMNGIKSGC
ncbi:hypothetical protein AWC38_SpisGene1499 [Stylophora pistillata]|uniref:Uncharacterized protein n=1 Tax=Stylophora pistillata TaxID=50429 RepID=A0A2B4SYW7_STYPI|nr:hypothetical protein AWC38_SpisGene1499 [Stylophora pistillata]